MVAFLLVYSADVEVIQNAKGIEVPKSVAEAQPKHSVVVMITKEQLFVQGELVASLDEDPRRADAADRVAARGARAPVAHQPTVARGARRRGARDHGYGATNHCPTTW